MKAFFLFTLIFVLYSQLFAQTAPDALQAFREGDYNRAILICLDEIAANPNNLESHVVITWSLMRLGRFTEAMHFARNGRNISRFDLRLLEALGQISYYLGQNAQALQYFQEFLSLAPDGFRVEIAYYYVGEIFIRMGHFRHADIALSTAVHRLPGNALWWTRLAYARENARDFQEAAMAYERALALNPQFADAQRGLERVRQALARL